MSEKNLMVGQVSTLSYCSSSSLYTTIFRHILKQKGRKFDQDQNPTPLTSSFSPSPTGSFSQSPSMSNMQLPAFDRTVTMQSIGPKAYNQSDYKHAIDRTTTMQSIESRSFILYAPESFSPYPFIFTIFSLVTSD